MSAWKKINFVPSLTSLVFGGVFRKPAWRVQEKRKEEKAGRRRRSATFTMLTYQPVSSYILKAFSPNLFFYLLILLRNRGTNVFNLTCRRRKGWRLSRCLLNKLKEWNIRKEREPVSQQKIILGEFRNYRLLFLWTRKETSCFAHMRWKWIE